jgi:ATP-dependent Clp protease ATP-binding subunit ClpA
MFERFTDRARTVLVEAQHEAVETGVGFIDTEHLLIGMLREGTGVAAVALNDHGVTLEQVREKVIAALGPRGGIDRATALATLGIDLDAVRSAVEAAFGEGALADPSTNPTGSAGSSRPAFTPRAKKALALALREMKELGHSYIGTEHLLLGLVSDGTSMATQILVSLGVNSGDLRERVYALLDGMSSGERWQGTGWQQRSSRVLDRGSIVVCSFCGRRTPDSGRVVAGRGAFICKNCLHEWTATLAQGLDDGIGG